MKYQVKNSFCFCYDFELMNLHFKNVFLPFIRLPARPSACHTTKTIVIFHKTIYYEILNDVKLFTTYKYHRSIGFRMHATQRNRCLVLNFVKWQ